MKVETAQIPVEGIDYEADEPASIMDYETDDCRFKNPVHLKLNISHNAQVS